MEHVRGFELNDLVFVGHSLKRRLQLQNYVSCIIRQQLIEPSLSQNGNPFT